MAQQTTENQPSLGILGSLGDIIASLGSGVLRGGASMGDLLLEYATRRYRGQDPEKSYLQNITGFRPLQELYEGSPVDYKPQTTAGEYAQTVGEFVPGGAIGKAPKVAKAAGILAGGIGSEGLSDLSKRVLGEWSEPYARVIGGTLVPFGTSRAYNRYIGIPRAEIPQRLTDKQMGQVKTIAASGREITEEPLMKWADRNVEGFASNLTKEVDDLAKLNNGINLKIQNLLSDKKADNQILINRMINKIEESGDDLRKLPHQSLDISNFIREQISKVGDRSLFGLHKLRQELSEQYDKPGAREAYRILRDFIAESAPGYSELLTQSNVGRQADIINNIIKGNLTRGTKDKGRALEKASNQIKNELEVHRKKLDFEALGSQGEGLENIVGGLEEYVKSLPDITPKAIQQAIGRASVGSTPSYISPDLANKSISTGALRTLGYLLGPSNAQKALQKLSPQSFASVGQEMVKGSISSTIPSGAYQDVLNQFFPPAAEQQEIFQPFIYEPETYSGPNPILEELRQESEDRDSTTNPILEEIISERNSVRR